MFEGLGIVADNILLRQLYLWPVILLIAEEAGLPIPASNYVMAYLGYKVAQGYLPFVVAFTILLVAELIGASILYFICSEYGPKVVERFGKYIHIDNNKLNLVEEKFRKFGSFVIIFGRHIPGLRLPITVFAGISEMKYSTFLISTIISTVWSIPIYLYAGQKLGAHTLHILHGHWWLGIFLLLPIVFTIAPFYFLRQKPKPSS